MKVAPFKALLAKFAFYLKTFRALPSISQASRSSSHIQQKTTEESLSRRAADAGKDKVMSDTDAKAEEDLSQNRDEAQDDGGDDEVREGPLRYHLYEGCASCQLGKKE